MNEFSEGEIKYKSVLLKDIQFGVALKVTPSKGNLVYEYNPFRNYRLSQITYFYKNRLFSPRELLIELGQITQDAQKSDKECIDIISNFTSWKGIIPESESNPVLLEAGELTDFETNELKFDINHPVEILPQYSYDNSVNLIINDGKNVPRLINSRFSATSKNQYQIVDRKGNNDTNIYDQGAQFDIDTSLYKRVVEIPRLRFIGINGGGKLPVGNYHFYFRYADADGNETDFVAESGLVSIFIGNDPSSTRTGFRNEDSHKSIHFLLTNVDSAYQYVNVYYTRTTSDVFENPTTTAVKIQQQFLVNNFLKCNIVITGYEDTQEVTISDINPMYQMSSSVETQEQCQNRLFLGNIQKPEIPYKEFEDLSLRFLPFLNDSENYPLKIDKDYNISSQSMGYYDPKYIYNKVGYWNHELYRLGIVYILSDSSLSPVFNIRGIENLNKNTQYSTIPLYDNNGGRNYIVTEEDTYKIVTDTQSYGIGITIKPSGKNLENSKGVISLGGGAYDTHKVFGLDIKTDKEVLNYLKNVLKIKGFFFVRQKRIPTILCQAYTIGIDKESKTPILPIKGGYLAERFINDDRTLTHDFNSRYYKFNNPNKVRTEGAICPEYDVDSPFFNTLFTGDKFSIQESDIQPQSQFLDLVDDRNFYVAGTIQGSTNNLYNVKIIGVEDNVKLVAINDNMFSARAGEAEEAFRYEYLEKENKITEASNLIRGSFGPYLGITGYPYSGKMIDIKIPGFNEISESDLFKVRYNDKSPFYAISDRISLKELDDWFSTYKEEDGSEIAKLDTPLYRGDCYICQFTHRLNRNFQDPQAPTNDKIVDPKCWKDNYEISDDVLKTENFDKINLGDVNAIKLGMWITLTVRSSKNLNIRSIDDSMTDEASLTGHPRGFYPYHPISPDGSYKIPEALCYNKGFEKALSERQNYEVPDVPAIKNDFTNRIAYSDIHVNDAFKNGYRVFQGTHYRDYPKTYGSITKLIELRGSLLCVFEHGVALIPVNERAVAGEGAGGNIYINTSNVLPENPKIISDTFGSQWKDSVIKTPMGIYGVDTVGKKIWRTNGEDFECISDFKVQEFLNKNISLTERETEPVIGIRNVKTHYNKFKHDIMFTFYDNLYGFEEKVWNLCYNELMQKWITFYSWVPSYSENIYNQYFSFDRNTSKWISKLGVSHIGNDFSDGVVLPNNIIPNEAKSGYRIGELSLANRTLPEGEGISVFTYYTLDRDNLGNFNYFDIKYQKYQIVNNKKSYIGDYVPLEKMLKDPDKNYDSILVLKTDSVNLCSELYVRGSNEEISTLETIIAKEGKWEKLSEELYRVYEDNNHSKYTDYNLKIHKCVEKKTTLEITLNFYPWLNNCVINSNYPIYKDDRGRRIQLSTIDKDRRLNGNKIVTLLNIRANILTTYGEKTSSLAEAYTSGFKNGTQVNAGYYQSVVAVMPQYNMQFLTTDFWKHGQAGIIDIADKIQPTYWYGKQHPFEFEFVVADNTQAHKIFDDLEIISNNAEPESFHYEIVGDCYDFSKDKKNMYIRQEATKELYQYNGSDILFNSDYVNLDSEHRKNYRIEEGQKIELKGYDRSTLLPLYYQRRDSINEIEDYYAGATAPSKDYSALAGGEVVRYDTLNEYHIWNHAKAVDVSDPTKGRMRGNMQYKEDKWHVQINPLNIVQKNEPQWTNLKGNPTNCVPVELNQNPLPSDVLDPTTMQVPSSFENGQGRGYVIWNWQESQIKEAKIKDKWLKVRIRYNGSKLAIITAIRTLYSISYS